MIENRIIANNSSSIVLYTTDDGNTRFEVKLEKNIVWLTQSQMVELFDIDRTIVEDTWEKCINQKNWKNFQLVQKMYRCECRVTEKSKETFTGLSAAKTYICQ